MDTDRIIKELSVLRPAEIQMICTKASLIAESVDKRRCFESAEKLKKAFANVGFPVKSGLMVRARDLPDLVYAICDYTLGNWAKGRRSAPTRYNRINVSYELYIRLFDGIAELMINNVQPARPSVYLEDTQEEAKS